jgi:hypothetical protein
MTRAVVKSTLVLLAALAVPAAASAQGDRLRIYGVALELYRHGQVDEALRLAGSWSPTTLKGDMGRILEDRDRHLAPGMVLLMTELARRDSKAASPEQLVIAETLVRNLPRHIPDAKAFQARWYAFITSLFIAELNPPVARILVDRGLRLVGQSPRLQLLSGIAFEMSTYPHAMCLADDCRSSENQRAVVRNLTLAADAYRQASALDPHAPDSHLRLGRVLHLLGDRDGARQELMEVERVTSNVEFLYLVALFRADLSREAGNVRAAAAEAERAVNLEPRYQSARIALAHLSDQLGLAGRSRKIVDEVFRLPPVGDPWWEFKQPAADVDSLEWLKAYVRK